MTLLLNCHDISKNIGPRSLFNSVSFTVTSGEKLGIIGSNGSGKTTLLRILAGLDTPDSGKISLAKNIRTGYLAQSDIFDDNLSVADVLYTCLDEPAIDDTEKYNRVHSMLSRAEFNDPECPVHNLSGGWRKRLAICRALIHRPDILLMDEPTNHLDLEGILWLEKLLGSSYPESPSAYVLVSHDRLFLENRTSRILEISPLYPAGYLNVDGNYSDFLEKKELFLDQQKEQETRLANRLRRETEWLRRGPKARSTKAKYRIDGAYKLHDEFSRIKTRNRENKTIQFDFSTTDRKTKKLLEASGLAKSYDSKVLFTDLDLVLSPGRRLGLLGKNGCGKSTLMQILASVAGTNNVTPDNGSIRVADGVKIISFTQNREQLDLNVTLRQALSPEGESVFYGDRSLHVVTWAKKFLFKADQLDTPVSTLSGGEQARILIADLMRQPADILLLDEPTNDLDIPSLQVLEESLIEFPGAVVLVTHDRFLMDRVCDSVLGFDGQGHVSFFADYKQCLAAYQENRKQKTKPKNQHDKEQKKSTGPGRLSYMDQREYDGMEEAIQLAEGKEAHLQQLMDNPDTASNPAKLEECWQQLEETRETIHRLYERWDELEQKKQGSSS